MWQTVERKFFKKKQLIAEAVNGQEVLSTHEPTLYCKAVSPWRCFESQIFQL